MPVLARCPDIFSDVKRVVIGYVERSIASKSDSIVVVRVFETVRTELFAESSDSIPNRSVQNPNSEDSIVLVVDKVSFHSIEFAEVRDGSCAPEPHDACPWHSFEMIDSHRDPVRRHDDVVPHHDKKLSSRSDCELIQ